MSQSNAIEQVKNRRFVIASIDKDGYFSMSTRPFYHTTATEALAEADRLASKDDTKVFVAMQLVGGSRVVSIRRI